MEHSIKSRPKILGPLPHDRSCNLLANSQESATGGSSAQSALSAAIQRATVAESAYASQCSASDGIVTLLRKEILAASATRSSTPLNLSQQAARAVLKSLLESALQLKRAAHYACAVTNASVKTTIRDHGVANASPATTTVPDNTRVRDLELALASSRQSQKAAEDALARHTADSGARARADTQLNAAEAKLESVSEELKVVQARLEQHEGELVKRDAELLAVKAARDVAVAHLAAVSAESSTLSARVSRHSRIVYLT